ncbi:hypothetical protein [Aggregatibacter aphrophilus]|uniref:Uncharacterized protein n=2 Tax=Aggregatibacter aphrophilus TaxID=732 RepID=A0A336N261_AGGAP|nr:hypothetical protein [Aggregatibacter aphrophilus]KNE85427.1 hypothetical protein ATCC33389_0205865 [Aggregatibacter aphrophilus ATCC 33389]MDU7785823.1 hypothetical protein [Aggregatibacter aphrophilus]OBY54438.1 hypothetical protein BBB51_04770 [Aggregatibacter aphrophilus]RDE88965.1 hypothetical protein DPW00_01300 [Aggregatibacter aphrophilus]SSY93046.1 Uncharacterised protein [Aggregatibacter aphrophilus]
MKNYIYLLSVFVYIPYAYSESCLGEKYNEVITEYLSIMNESYSRVKNISDCQVNSSLNNLVCSNDKLKNEMHLLSIGEIYAYENATHTPVADYSTYNNDFKDWLNNLVKSEKNKDIALRKLCYVIKTKLSDDFGSDFSYTPDIYEVISSKANSNGVVVYNLSSIIYLGKSCDAVVSGYKDIKSIWYNDGDQFVIAQSDKNGKFEEKYRFNHDDKVAKLNCEKPKN